MLCFKYNRLILLRYFEVCWNKVKATQNVTRLIDKYGFVEKLTLVSEVTEPFQFFNFVTQRIMLLAKVYFSD